MSYNDVSLVDEYKVVVHFPGRDQNYRVVTDNEYESRTKADNLCKSAGGASWTLYRALGDMYRGQGSIGPDGSRTPIWCYNIIGWRSVVTTRTYRNMELADINMRDWHEMMGQ
jgi:hypothetical protein